MKKFFITSATLCLGWLSAGAQQMSAEQATVDCGQVIFAHPVTVEYKLRNDATKPLVITKVYTSCGCATVSYPKSVIAAGDSFTVSATYDAQQMGHFEKLVGVYGTNGENPLMLTMKGVVVSEKQDFSGQYPYKIGDFLCDVADLEFDDVNVGDKPMAKIHIMNNTDETLSPTMLHVPAYLRATISPAKLAPGHAGVATITLDSRRIRDYGLTQTAIYLGSDVADKVAPEKEISVSTVLLPNFEMSKQQRLNAPQMVISASEFNLGSFGKKKKLKGVIQISNRGRSTLLVTSLQMFTSGLQVELDNRSIAPGGKANLKVTAIKEELKNVRTAPRVLMITNDPDHPKVVLKVKAK